MGSKNKPAANAGKGPPTAPPEAPEATPEQLLADAEAKAAAIVADAEAAAAESKAKAEEDAEKIRADASKEDEAKNGREEASGLGGIRELAAELAKQVSGGRHAISQRPPTYKEAPEGADLSEVSLFWLTASRHIAEVGDVRPKYVDANPQNPAQVRLRRYYERRVEQRDDFGRRNGLFKTIVCETGDKFCIRQDKAPQPPQHTHVKHDVAKPSAAAHHGAPVDPPAPLPNVSVEDSVPGRAADK